MLKVGVLVLVCVVGSALKLVVNVQRAEGAKCFYLSLKQNEKYFFQVVTRTHRGFQLDVMRSEGSRWEEVFKRTADSVIESLSKYAPAAGTYMFCVSNNDERATLRAQVEILSGLELGNLDYLPSDDDQLGLHREIDWLDAQKRKIIEAVNRQQATSAADLASQMSLKFIVLAVVGLASVVAVNAAFYFQTKKTLRDRKLI